MQMELPIETHPDPERTLSHAHMRELVSQTLAHGFTGLVTVSFLLGEEVKLLIQGGQIREMLLKNKGQHVRLPGEKYHDADLFEGSRMGHLRLQKSPGRFLICERACFESPALETHKGVQNTALERLFTALENHESATIISVRWQNAQAYVLVPGANLSMRRAVFVAGSQVEVDDSALSTMTYWQETRCDTAIYQGALETDTWIALHLNILFEYISAHLLNQCAYLTGRVMVNSMVRSLAFVAPQYKCELTSATSQLQDQTLFPSLSETEAAYKGLLDFLETQMATVIGSSYLQVVKKQSLGTLNPFYANLVRYYGF